MPDFTKFRNAGFRLCLFRCGLRLFAYLTSRSSILTWFRAFGNQNLDAWHSSQLVCADCMLLISLCNRDDFILDLLFDLLFDLLNLFLFESIVLSVALDLVLNDTDIFVGSVNILKHALLLYCNRLLQSLK
jgi:hypothetical protein